MIVTKITMIMTKVIETMTKIIMIMTEVITENDINDAFWRSQGCTLQNELLILSKRTAHFKE